MPALEEGLDEFLCPSLLNALVGARAVGKIRFTKDRIGFGASGAAASVDLEGGTATVAEDSSSLGCSPLDVLELLTARLGV